MKFFYLALITFITLQFSYSQCVDNSQILNAGLNKITFFDDDNGFAIGHGTMIRTTDGGENWQSVLLPVKVSFTEKTLSSVAILDENTAVIAGDGATLIKTTDKGATWNIITMDLPENINYYNVDFIDNQIGYLMGFSYNEATWPGHFYLLKTIDGGNSWTEINTHFNTNPSIIYLYTTKFLDELNGFAWTQKSLFKTIDGGLNWTEVVNPSGSEFSTDYISGIKKSEDGTLIMSTLATLASFYKSVDYGESWTLINALSPQNNIYSTSTAFDIKDNKIFIVAEVGSTITRSFITYDIQLDTASYNSISAEYLGNQSDIYFVNSTVAYIIDRGNAYWSDTPGRKILKTTDIGKTWSELDSFSIQEPGTNNYMKFLQNSDTTYTMSKFDGYGDSLGFYIYVSQDKGATWQQKVHENINFATLLYAKENYISYIKFKVPTNGGEGYLLCESYDLGITWVYSDIANPYDNGFALYSQLDVNTLQYGGLYGEPWSFSEDKGKTWTTVPLPVLKNMVTAGMTMKGRNEFYVWAVYDNWPVKYDYYLYKSIDRGQTWQQVVIIPDNKGIDMGVTAATTYIGNDFAFVSTGGNKYYTVDIAAKAYQETAFINPDPNSVYIGQEQMVLLSDTTWLLKSYDANSSFSITSDNGASWTDVPCVICGATIILSKTSELFTYNSEYGAERLKTYLPHTPQIYGSIKSDTHSQEKYTVTDVGLDVLWIVSKGGVITDTSKDGKTITVDWVYGGLQFVKAVAKNECGTSDYVLQVNVSEPLSVNQSVVNANIIVSPNPFSDKLMVDLQNILNADLISVTIASVTGQVVYNKLYKNSNFTINNLDLPTGFYFLKINSNGKEYVEKIIRQ